jgi:hypothetical protein
LGVIGGDHIKLLSAPNRAATLRMEDESKGGIYLCW